MRPYGFDLVFMGSYMFLRVLTDPFGFRKFLICPYWSYGSL